MKKQLNFEIQDGDSFSADEVTIVHNPTKLVFDFKSVTPRFDVRNQDMQPMVIKHNVVLVDIQMAKRLLEILKENITSYEKRFGRIQTPAVVKKAKKNAIDEPSDQPTYFG